MFRVRGLTKVYGAGAAEVRALAGVDLDLYAGELVVLLGPSGSGKTTLLNNLGGLDVPTAGELKYRGQDLAAFDETALTRYRRDTVGFVFQFYNLIPSLTARENVGLITEIARDPMPAEAALEMVNLGARLDHFPAQLSGGEQQRVAIARAIAKRPAGAAVRRTDRRAGCAHGHRGAGGHRAREPRAGHADRHHHAQRRHGRHGRPGDSSVRWPRPSRAGERAPGAGQLV